MKIVNSYIFRAVCALLIGLLLVSNPERMTGFVGSGNRWVVSYFRFGVTHQLFHHPLFG